MTALELIYWMQRPHVAGKFHELCKFEAVVWVCVMACAQLGMNLNDSRFPGLKPAETA